MVFTTFNQPKVHNMENRTSKVATARGTVPGATANNNKNNTQAASNPVQSPPLFNYKKTSWRKVAPCLAFLAAFSTAMALLLVWSEAVALRRQAFDVNMTKDYVLDNISMDNPQLANYIREMHLKPTTHQEPLNATQTLEGQCIAKHLNNKREGVYVEYLRAGGASNTAWLESNLGWKGVMIMTDPKSYFEAIKSSRNVKTRVLHACLSTDSDTKEITYHQEPEVKMTKLEEGPNSLTSVDENLTPTRLKCFPLYSILLAYNATTLDYLSLDSLDAQEVLDTIPWDKIRITMLSIRWSPPPSDSDTTNLIQTLSKRRYTRVDTTDIGKGIFYYDRPMKI
ncbi:protein Star-like [Prorops nasuta]|uniref:protein Star-like n=1 Tax=Prorops nasuta TaxID=863751 RepID=UPI0034CF0833